VKVHGLTDEFLADKPKFAEVADDLLDSWPGPNSSSTTPPSTSPSSMPNWRLKAWRITDVVGGSPTRC
jgi:hypothetical protein